MQLVIEKIDRSKSVNTQRGPMVKVGVFSQGTWYSCLTSSWNQCWNQGDTINVNIEEKHVNGKVFKNITGLANGPVVQNTQSAPSAPNPSIQILKDISAKLDTIVNFLADKNVSNAAQSLNATPVVPQFGDEIPF